MRGVVREIRENYLFHRFYKSVAFQELMERAVRDYEAGDVEEGGWEMGEED
jgi:hypothetical protein